jgi:DNA-binding transcriptional LysR family regulator
MSISFAGGPTAAYRALRAGELDVAIGRFLDVPDDCIATRLFEEDYLVLARAGRTDFSALDVGTYAEQRHVVVSFVGDLTGSIDQHLAAHGLKRRVAAAVPMFLAAFAAVAASDLLVTAPRRLALRFADRFGLRSYDPPIALPSFGVDLLQARSGLADSGTAWLVGQIRGILERPAESAINADGRFA